jgi:hypothetical protein
MRDNPGAQYEISVDGVPRTHRDRPDIALPNRAVPEVPESKSVIKLKDLQTARRSWSPSKLANRSGHGVYKDDVDYRVLVQRVVHRPHLSDPHRPQLSGFRGTVRSSKPARMSLRRAGSSGRRGQGWKRSADL